MVRGSPAIRLPHVPHLHLQPTARRVQSKAQTSGARQKKNWAQLIFFDEKWQKRAKFISARNGRYTEKVYEIALLNNLITPQKQVYLSVGQSGALNNNNKTVPTFQFDKLW